MNATPLTEFAHFAMAGSLAFLLVVVLIACWIMSLFALPGNWLGVLFVALYAFFAPATGRTDIGWPVVIVLLLLAAGGELIEFAAGAIGAAKVGGSKRGAILSLIGSMAGVFLGAPIGTAITPVIGTVIVAILFGGLGALGGAMLGELWKGRTVNEGWQVGKVAFWGRLFGTMAKSLMGAAMIAVTILALIL